MSPQTLPEDTVRATERNLAKANKLLEGASKAHREALEANKPKEVLETRQEKARLQELADGYQAVLQRHRKAQRLFEATET